MFGKPGLSTLGIALCLCVGCETNPITGREELMLVSENQDVEYLRQEVRMNYFNSTNLKVGKEDYRRAVLDQLERD